MQGHWQKETPSKDGRYWTATRDGKLAGIEVVAYFNGKLVFAAFPIRNQKFDGWGGWWWSEPVETPALPPSW